MPLAVFGLTVASYYKITEKKSRRDLQGLNTGEIKLDAFLETILNLAEIT
jgi:hypothetical protein